MRKLVIIIAVLLAMAAVAALPHGEKKVTADGNVNVRGSSKIELSSDGEAKITVRYNGGKTSPAAAAGDTSFTLTERSPREFSGLLLEDVYVDLVDATYVVVTWQ